MQLICQTFDVSRNLLTSSRFAAKIVRGWHSWNESAKHSNNQEVKTLMDFRIRPLADRVVIRPQEKEEKTRGGIFLPDTASKEKPQEGTVMAVGEGKLDDNGKRTPVAVKTGDKVLFAKYAGTEIKIEDEDFLILAEKDILAVVSE